MIKLILTFLLISPTPLLALINGTSMAGSSDIVRLHFTNGWVCSGVYINVKTILTAAHCLYNGSNNEAVKLAKIVSVNEGVIDVKHLETFIHPDFKAQAWPAYDIGIIKTTDNKFYQGQFILSKKATRSGVAELYGCGRDNVIKKEYKRTMGENSFLQIGSVLLFVDSKTETLIAPNDSGAPIIDKATGDIIGIAVSTTLRKSLKYGLPIVSSGTSTTIESNLNFILKHF